jgi:hypothetical protein
MLKFSFKCGPFGVTVEAETIKEFMAHASRIFELFKDSQCTRCRSPQGVAPRVRFAQGYTFYEMYCLNNECRAKLTFGQENDEKAGNPLFPHRKNEDGAYDTEFHGWKIWRGDNEYEPPSEPLPSRQAGRPMPGPRATAPTPVAPPPTPPPNEPWRQHADFKELYARVQAKQHEDVYQLLFDRITDAPQGGADHARSAWEDATVKDSHNDVVVFTELYRIHLRYFTPSK